MASQSSQFADTPPPTPTMRPNGQPRIYYFISRSNGRLVPLIPADELPYSVRLAGIPRVITLEQTCGMQHIGMLPYTGQFFKLEDNKLARTTIQLSDTPSHVRNASGTSTPTQFLAPDALIRPTINHGQTSTPTTLPARPISAAATAKNWRNPNPDPVTPPADSTQALIDAIVAANTESATQIGYPTPKSTPPLPSDLNGKKQYCTYWIRHGECDYIQQGCRYLHEMPGRATLEIIGFRTVPRWWQEKTAPNLGGSRVPTVEGRVVKSEEWLKRRDSAVSDADDESEAASDDGSSSAESEDDRSRKVSLSASEKIPEPTKPLTTRKQTPPPIVVRKPSSTPSVDLLKFAPLIPNPSSSINSSTPATSNTASPAVHAASPHQHYTQPRNAAKPSLAVVRKVFVPAGESADFHVEQARKASEARRALQPVQSTLTPIRSVITHHPARAAPQGLLASKHAPCSPFARQRSPPSATNVASMLPTNATALPSTTRKPLTPAAGDSRFRQSRRISLVGSDVRADDRPAKARAVERRSSIEKRTAERHASATSVQAKRFPRVEGRVRRAVGFPAPGGAGKRERSERDQVKGGKEAKTGVEKSVGKNGKVGAGKTGSETVVGK